MITTHKIKLDFNLQDTIPRIRAVQGDQYSRMVEISLHSNTVPWIIPENTTALIRYRKPNRTIGVYDTLPNGESAFQLNDNVITMTIAPDLLTVPGDVSIIVSLICGEQILSTFEMVLEVLANHNTDNPSTGASGYISGLLPSPRYAQERQILAVDKIDGNGAVLATSAIDLPPYNSIQSISQDTEASTNLETVYNVNLSDGTQHSFTVKNGADGQSGKSAYDYAKDAGYTGTEGEFATKLTKGYPNTSVTEYGAKGDGVSNDTKAFQDALTENRVVFVPGGTYVLSGTLVIRENCGLELSQDTVLKFTQASGNCIEMRGSAVLRGNHAMICVPYGFTGNVISMDTSQEGENHNNIPPYLHSGSHMFKRQRFIYDINIVKPNAIGLCRSNDGKCTGTAIYMHCLGTASIRWMWAITMRGVRIAGGFSYGIRAYNIDKTGDVEDNAWNHDMRIEAVIEACEVAVALENCNGAHLAVTVQPCKAENTGTAYAKHGIYLNDARFVDLIGSRVWDWDVKNTLWTSGGQYQHIAMVGNCNGLIFDDFLCHEHAEDIRDLIYTDNESNFETMSVLQEPSSKNFKTVKGEPHFDNGNTNLRIVTEKELSEYFQTDRIPGFSNVLETAIDRNGNVYGTRSGYYDSRFNTLNDDGYHTHTGFIACKKGDTFYTDGIKLRDNGCVRISLFDSSFNYIMHANAGNMMKADSYYFNYTETGSGFQLTLKSLDDANVNKFSYARFNFCNDDMSKYPLMSVNGEIKHTVEGFLADGVKVKAENIIGLENVSGGASSWNDLADKPFGENDNAVLLPETQFVFDSSMGLFFIPGYIDFIVGKTYTVHWNGTEYTTEAVPGLFNGQSLVMIGNPYALGGANNGLPFAVACLLGAIGAIPLDGSTAVNVGITGYGVVPMPSKYKNEYHLKMTIEKRTGSSTYSAPEGLVSYAEYVLQSGGSLFLDVTYVNSSGGDMICIMPLVAYGKDLRGFLLPDAFFDDFDPNSGRNCLIFASSHEVCDSPLVLCPQADGTYK